MVTVARSAVKTTASDLCTRLTKKNSVGSGSTSSAIGMVMEDKISPGGKRREPIPRTKSEPSN